MNYTSQAISWHLKVLLVMECDILGLYSLYSWNASNLEHCPSHSRQGFHASIHHLEQWIQEENSPSEKIKLFQLHMKHHSLDETRYTFIKYIKLKPHSLVFKFWRVMLCVHNISWTPCRHIFIHYYIGCETQSKWGVCVGTVSEKCHVHITFHTFEILYESC